ncbi:hypothetical protein HOLleu_43399 [Holothuria leucospilota]|uniref:Zinc finger PHD-type domain-containing protein n=1 Tax=Holothuria leucospilota TaxID=206669 RepID=A0A9Q1B9Q9_HOLLE|nr:hypothetical protein HOLleu_43399 [Holothuria leucospilota]
MSKVRSLRIFLRNLNINVLPSESKIYSELQERQKVYRSDKPKVEVGTCMLKKTTTSEKTETAFIRFKSIKQHAEQTIRRHFETGLLDCSSHFQEKIWIKIGGDKGGSTTKLAMQVVNIPGCNSPHNTHLLGMFEATDSIENLHSIFGSFTDEFISMQKVDYFVNMSGKNYTLNVFLFGDYEFLCKVIGHMGASASFPCLWCHVKLSDLGYNLGPHSPMLWDEEFDNFKPNPVWPSRRTIASMNTDLTNNKADPRRGGDRRANGANHHSMAEDPILPVITDVCNIVPPSLHILLGLVVRYYRMLEIHCRQIDATSLGERDHELYVEWERVSSFTKEAELLYLDCKDSLREEEEVLSNFKRAVNYTGKPENVRCSMPLCAISAIGAMGDVEWIQCTQCGTDRDSGWYHFTCLRLTEESAATFTVCPVCKGEITSGADVLTSQRQQISKKKAEVSQAKSEYDVAKSKLDSVYARVLAKRGPKEIELNRILENDLKVQKRAYHSQCFVGNHCKIILQNVEKLLIVIDDKPLQTKLYELFSKLREIFSLFDARFLSSEEVTRLCHLCWALGEWFPVAFPDEKIPPKLHFLIAHIPECAIKWKTVGLLSEHGLESIHSCLNSEERIYSCVRDKTKKLFHIFSNHSQKAVADRHKLTVVKRKCSIEGCGGRFKLIEGIRKCQKCGVLSA